MAAIKQINNSFLFANIATITASLKSFVYDPNTIVTLVLYGVFFIFFRFKAYLDDNKSINIRRDRRKQFADGIPDSGDKLTAIVSIASWCMYSIGGYYLLLEPDLSQKWLLCSIIAFTLLIIFIAIFRKQLYKQEKELTAASDIEMRHNETNENHALYFGCNLIYIFILALLQSQKFNELDTLFCAILLLTLLFDYYMSESLDNIYVPYS